MVEDNTEQARPWKTDDYAEGFPAFHEKREPKFNRRREPKELRYLISPQVRPLSGDKSP